MRRLFGCRGLGGVLRARGVAALMVTSVVAAACSGAPSESTPSEASTPSAASSPSEVDEPAATEESSVAVTGRPEVAEQDCAEFLARTGLRCVLVTVPIDRADPAAGNTQVSVAIRPGTGDESLAPLAVLQGGPGGASSELAPFLPSRPYAQVFIDQRGVGFRQLQFLVP